MAPTNEPLAWQYNLNDSFIPITHEGKVIGLSRPDYAVRMIEVLNRDANLSKALRMACIDLLTLSGGDISAADELVQKYLERAARPKHGTRAIAFLLRDRQAELDVSDEEFIKFCDSYRLPREDLKSIYAGERIPNHLLSPLARILGKTVDEIVEVRDGAGK